jgi:methylated-DNA-protein-cysteine methyltransferase-like protein
MSSDFNRAVLKCLSRVPRGRVVTYGQVATMAGNPRAARQVVRVLHASSDSEKLPWHRVVNRDGKISLPRGSGYELQRAMLRDEGVAFDSDDRIDLSTFLWKPRAGL